MLIHRQENIMYHIHIPFAAFLINKVTNPKQRELGFKRCNHLEKGGPRQSFGEPRQSFGIPNVQ